MISLSLVQCCLQIPIGAETVGVGADDLEELEDDNEEYLRLGQEDENEADFSKLQLKPDHQNRLSTLCQQLFSARHYMAHIDVLPL